MKNVSILLLFALIFFSCEKKPVIIDEPIEEKTETKILFVGNSFTYYNSGVDFNLQKIIEADTIKDEMTYIINSVTEGSYTLEAHWNDIKSTDKIVSDNWDYVVLQEQSTRPINNIDLFYQYARLLNTLIINRDSKTVFYMTWARKDQPQDISALDAAYSVICEELNAELAPVGRAFEYVINTYPEIALHIDDNKHPTPAGTYLSACIFEIVLCNKNPKNSTFIPPGVTEANVLRLKEAAWDFMQNQK